MELKQELYTSDILLVKLLSFLFWTSYYLWWASERDHSPEWCSRIVTLLHGTVATCVGLSQCGIKSFSTYSLTTKLTWGQYALMVWSWGYFTFDLLWCLLYWNNSYTMICHHISAIVAINFYLSKDYTGCTFSCTIALLEITNPLLQTRWFLREGGYNNTVIYYAVELTYLFLFLSLRGLLGTYLFWKIIWMDTFCFSEKMISLALYLISMIFVYEILGYVFYRYKNKLEEFTGFANETNNRNEVEAI